MEHTRLVQRLVELRAELECGQQVMAELDSKRATLTNTLLRISGAIQVLEELRDQEERTGGNGSEPMDETPAATVDVESEPVGELVQQM